MKNIAKIGKIKKQLIIAAIIIPAGFSLEILVALIAKLL